VRREPAEAVEAGVVVHLELGRPLVLDVERLAVFRQAEGLKDAVDGLHLLPEILDVLRVAFADFGRDADADRESHLLSLLPESGRN
jgi:hypothetical protein